MTKSEATRTLQNLKNRQQQAKTSQRQAAAANAEDATAPQQIAPVGSVEKRELVAETELGTMRTEAIVATFDGNARIFSDGKTVAENKKSARKWIRRQRDEWQQKHGRTLSRKNVTARITAESKRLHTIDDKLAASLDDDERKHLSDAIAAVDALLESLSK